MEQRYSRGKLGRAYILEGSSSLQSVQYRRRPATYGL